MKKTKRIIAIILTLAFVLPLVSCNAWNEFWTEFNGGSSTTTTTRAPCCAPSRAATNTGWITLSPGPPFPPPFLSEKKSFKPSHDTNASMANASESSTIIFFIINLLTEKQVKLISIQISRLTLLLILFLEELYHLFIHLSTTGARIKV